ncbi:sulfurtransferase TusA family protein [Alicyclobacillus dauci]|uniref:Sulfurtransferase TusA family protein n=1 Tax=Alicyclobacillus dauci TaxID=1475485 RepID=A0ABY6Z182_9BACL|nr:sulfurtransferase TusA family protein [Alicyclobacillus dauci]WAH36442.1 sulfurtransferase TusA family protein [Alicyclobacillus dauci]
MEADIFVDAKGLSCPMPIVKAKKAIEGLESGQIMQLESTDKGSLNDFQSWVKRTNNELVKVEEDNDVFRFFVKKG